MIHKIAIIGSGRRGTSLMELFNEEKNIEVIGVADIDDDTPASVKAEYRCLAKAPKYNIQIFSDYIDLIKRKDINIIVDATRSEDCNKKISQNVRQKVEILKGNIAELFWQLVKQREENKEKEVKKLEEEKEKYVALYDEFLKLPPDRDNEDEDIFDIVVKKAVEMLKADRGELFLLGETGEDVELIATTDNFLKKKMETGFICCYAKGEGLTGWIFKTGKPLWIDDLEKFKQEVILSDDNLCEISNDSEINKDDDRVIRWLDKDKQFEHCPGECFLGVPIISQNGEILGVLRVSSKRYILRSELSTLQELAAIFSVVLYSKKEKRLKDTLIKLGAIYDKDELFRCVVAEVSKLVLGRGCSIFLLDSEGKELKLAYSNKPYSMERVKNGTEEKKDIPSYAIGEGKTGLAAKFKRTLIINYYGTGNTERKRLEYDYNKFQRDKNSIAMLLYHENKKVGLIRLHRNENEPEFTHVEEKALNKELKNQNYSFFKIMDSPKHFHETKPDEHSISFLGLPIKDVEGKLIGVLRIPRTFAGSIFSEDDVAFIESIINRITIVLEKERFLKTNLEILSEINSKISASVDKDVILDRILEDTTDKIGFEFATLQLADVTKNIIWTEKGMKNSTIDGALNPKEWGGELWGGLAVHPLNPPPGQKRDVHAWVLMKLEKEIVIEGWNEHFDKKIYEKYHHENLIRAFVPIIALSEDGKSIKIGTLEAGHNINRKDFIDDTELEMLKALANQAAIAIQHAWLFSKTDAVLQKKVTELKTLYDIGTKITSQFNLKNVLDSIVEHASKILGETLNMGIFLVDLQNRVLNLESTYTRIKNTPPLRTNFTIPLEGRDGKSLTAYAFNKNELIYEKDVSKNPFYLKITKNICSELDIPLRYKDEVIGVLNAESEKKDGFSKDMIDKLTNFAQQAAIAIKNAQLLKQYKDTNEQLRTVLRLLDHQLKDHPININEACEELLEDENPSPEKRKDCLEVIYNESFWVCQDLNNIGTWHNLTELLIKDEPHLLIKDEPQKDIYLKEEFEKITHSLAWRIRAKKISVFNRIKDNLPPIKTYYKYASLIFANLLGNAIKYSEEDGEISIIAKIRKNQLTINIEDNGIGVPKEDQHKVFNEFGRGTNVEGIGGTGLGCYIVKKLCDILGWNVSFKSPIKDNKGTRFSISICY